MASITKRISKNGTASWRISIRKKGFPNIDKTFETEEEATIFAQEIELSWSTKETIPKLPLKVFFERYEQEILPEHTHHYKLSYKRHTEFWVKHLGNDIATEIVSSDLERILDHLLHSESRLGTLMTSTTGKRYLATLSIVYSTAMRKWKWATHNPCICVNLENKSVKAADIPSRKFRIDEGLGQRKKQLITKIQEAMSKQNKSQQNVATESGLTKTSVQTVLNYEMNAGLYNIMAVCRALKVGIEIKWD